MRVELMVFANDVAVVVVIGHVQDEITIEGSCRKICCLGGKILRNPIRHSEALVFKKKMM